jgi:hypothetical protein
MKHVKYIIINIIPILVFLGIWGLLYYFIENSTLLEAVFYVFPFVYYAIVAIIDTYTSKEISHFGRDTRNFYFIISAIVLIIGIITTIYWFVTGKTDFASTYFISWDYNYVWNFIFYLLPSILILIIGLSANVYIWLISYVFLKIKSKLKTTK